MTRRGHDVDLSPRDPDAPSDEPARPGWKLRLPQMRTKSLKPDSLRIFYRSLATLLASGVRIDRALDLLGRQEDDPHLAAITRAMAVVVSRGGALSDAMSPWPNEFGELERRLVKVGEMTGNLDHLLERIAVYEERRRAITMRVRSALTYPAFIFGLTLIALVVLPPYLFGGLFGLIESLGVEVSMLTRVVLAFAKIVSSPWFGVFVGVTTIVGVRMLPRLLAQPRVQLRLAHIGLRLPVLGKALRTIAVTRFARALEIMMSCGVSIDQGLRMSLAASGNPVLVEHTEDVCERLFAGATLRESLEVSDVFGRAFLQVVNVGEESGRLPELLSRLAAMYEVQLDHTLETAVAALEPAMMLVMGFFVGIFIIASMQPMSQILEKL